RMFLSASAPGRAATAVRKASTAAIIGAVSVLTRRSPSVTPRRTVGANGSRKAPSAVIVSSGRMSPAAGSTPMPRTAAPPRRRPGGAASRTARSISSPPSSRRWRMRGPLSVRQYEQRRLQWYVAYSHSRSPIRPSATAASTAARTSLAGITGEGYYRPRAGLREQKGSNPGYSGCEREPGEQAVRVQQDRQALVELGHPVDESEWALATASIWSAETVSTSSTLSTITPAVPPGVSTTAILALSECWWLRPSRMARSQTGTILPRRLMTPRIHG